MVTGWIYSLRDLHHEIHHIRFGLLSRDYSVNLNRGKI